MSPQTFLAAGSMLDCSHSEQLRAAAAAGFDGVGIRIREDDSPRSLQLVARAATDAGLVVNEVEVHRIGPYATTIDWLLECANAVGAENCLVVSDLADDAGTVDALLSINDRCRDAHVRLAIEYMAWTSPADAVSANRMATEIGCGVVADLLHHVRAGAGPGELTAFVASGVLAWVQLCDAPIPAPDDLLQEARHHRLVPGQGELPLRALLEAVPSEVPLSIEVQSDDLLEVAPMERARLLLDSAHRVCAPSQTSSLQRDGTAGSEDRRGP